MVVVLFAPGDEIEGYKVVRVLPSEGEIQKYLVVAGDGRELVLYCWIKRRSSSEETKVFYARAKARKELKHKHLPPIDGAGYARDSFYWVAEEAPPGGKTLRHLMDNRLAWPGADTYMVLVHSVAVAMRAALQQKFAHFGLTPWHIYINEKDFELVAVTGVGIRMVFDATPAPTPREELVYRAPEQVRRLDADFRADIYAMGMMLYELLSGEPPYADNLREIGVFDIQDASEIVLDAIKSVDPTRISEKVEGIDHAVEKLVVKMSQRNPGNRMATWEHVTAGITHVGASFVAAMLMTRSGLREQLEQTLAASGSPTIRELVSSFESSVGDGESDRGLMVVDAGTLTTNLPLLPGHPAPSNDPVLRERAPRARWLAVASCFVGALVAGALVFLWISKPVVLEVAYLPSVWIDIPAVVQTTAPVTEPAPTSTPVELPVPSPSPVSTPAPAPVPVHAAPVEQVDEKPSREPHEALDSSAAVPEPSEPASVKAKASPPKQETPSKEMLRKLWR